MQGPCHHPRPCQPQLDVRFPDSGLRLAMGPRLECQPRPGVFPISRGLFGPAGIYSPSVKSHSLAPRIINLNFLPVPDCQSSVVIVAWSLCALQMGRSDLWILYPPHLTQWA